MPCRSLPPRARVHVVLLALLLAMVPEGRVARLLVNDTLGSDTDRCPEPTSHQNCTKTFMASTTCIEGMFCAADASRPHPRPRCAARPHLCSTAALLALLAVVATIRPAASRLSLGHLDHRNPRVLVVFDVAGFDVAGVPAPPLPTMSCASRHRRRSRGGLQHPPLGNGDPLPGWPVGELHTVRGQVVQQHGAAGQGRVLPVRVREAKQNPQIAWGAGGLRFH